MATSLRAYLMKGNPITIDANSQPILRGFANRNLRPSERLFTAVTVGGYPPVSVAMVDHFLAYTKVEEVLDHLDQMWPDGLATPTEHDQGQRLHTHGTRLQVLDWILALGSLVVQMDAALGSIGIPPINWTDQSEMRKLQWVIQLLDARAELWSVGERFARLEHSLKAVSELPDAARCVSELEEAVLRRDVDGYRSASDRLNQLLEIRTPSERRSMLRTRLQQSAPILAARIRHHPEDPSWDRWLPEFEEAWQWAVIGAWLSGQEPLDVPLIESQLAAIERDIHGQVGELASWRAWRHVNDPLRMTPKARADLDRFTSLARQSTAGAAVRASGHAELREALAQCRPTIPSWIMPVYRIAEQLEIAPNLFDVAVVDDVFQGSLEWAILQYLAPKLVVIGDRCA